MKIIKRMVEKIRDPEIPLHDRMFMLITLVTVIAVIIVFIGDIIIGEDIREIITLGISVVVAPLIGALSMYYRKRNIGVILIVLGIIFGILPVCFFYGGGLYGGSVIWYAFAYLYIGLVMQGVMRIVMIVALTVISIVQYVLAYFHPEYIYVHHSEQMFYLDSIISVITVGLVIFLLVGFLTRLYMLENKRAKD